MDESVVLEPEIAQCSGSAQKNNSYVLHGAIASCTFGSRNSRLKLPLCHRTYVHGFPVMTINDSVPLTNVQPFGVCSSPSNPERETAKENVLETVQNDRKWYDGIIEFFCGSMDRGTAESLDQYITVACMPCISGDTKWNPGAVRYRLGEEYVLHNLCTLNCQYGGIISIVDDGQSNAINAQKSLDEIENWDGNPPYPTPTGEGVEKLKGDISELQEKIDAATGEEKGKLKQELEKKEQLLTNMEETVGLLNDLKLRQSDSGEINADNLVASMKATGQIDDMIKDGVTDQNKKVLTTEQDVEQYIRDNVKMNNEYVKSLDDSENTILEQYQKGNTCVKLEDSQINETFNNTVTAVCQNQQTNGVNTLLAVPLFGQNPFYVTNADVIHETTTSSQTYQDAVAKSGGNTSTKNIYYNGVMLSPEEYEQTITKSVRDSLPNDFE